MSRLEKLTTKFNKTKLETAWLILAAALMILGSPAYAEVETGYYESGQLKSKWNYKDGKQEGISKLYKESGQLWWEGNYKNGVMINQKKYDSDGNLESD